MAAIALTGTRAVSETEALAAVRTFLARRVPASVAYASPLPALSDDVHAQLTRLADELERYTGASSAGAAAAEPVGAGAAAGEKSAKKKHKRERADSAASSEHKAKKSKRG